MISFSFILQLPCNYKGRLGIYIHFSYYLHHKFQVCNYYYFVAFTATLLLLLLLVMAPRKNGKANVAANRGQVMHPKPGSLTLSLNILSSDRWLLYCSTKSKESRFESKSGVKG